MSKEVGAVNLAVMGAGSVRCMPAVIGSLATYFGERPLDIRFWDADFERLDLFDRFARTCFLFNKCSHELMSTIDPVEAAEGATHVIIAVGENCARKFLGQKDGGDSEELIADAALKSLACVPDYADILSLISPRISLDQRAVWRLSWPHEPSNAERMAVPHQVLRFIHGDEYPHEFFRSYENSPVKDWLENRPPLE